VTENRSTDIVEAALKTGAGGYVLKSDAGSDLLPAIRAVLEGKRFISTSLAGQFLIAVVGTLHAAAHFSWILAVISGMTLGHMHSRTLPSRQASAGLLRTNLSQPSPSASCRGVPVNW
jgi:DNA-binding NarL/FixJ family response regulator